MVLLPERKGEGRGQLEASAKAYARAQRRQELWRHDGLAIRRLRNVSGLKTALARSQAELCTARSAPRRASGSRRNAGRWHTVANETGGASVRAAAACGGAARRCSALAAHVRQG